MPAPRKAPTQQVRLAIFASKELEDLVDTLLTQLRFETSAVTVLGALVLAARRLPPEIVRELIPAYIAREQVELQKPGPSE
jgi:hypothetical protein